MFGAKLAAPRCRRRRRPTGSRRVGVSELPDAPPERGPWPFGARMRFVRSDSGAFRDCSESSLRARRFWVDPRGQLDGDEPDDESAHVLSSQRGMLCASVTWRPTFEVERAHDFERAGRDAFGHKEVAQVLTSAVRAAPSPTTIGLFGPWGSGKTSILLETRRLLSREAPDSAFVIFDVWRYEGDSLRRAFLSDVSQQLKDGGWLKRYFSRVDLLKELLTDRTTPSDRMRLSGKDLGVALF